MSRADIYRVALQLQNQNEELKERIVRADAEYVNAQEDIKRLKEEKQECHNELVALISASLKRQRGNEANRKAE